MNTHNISSQIVQCLGDVWAKKMLYDFTVKIGDEAIECHGLILAACSDFFKDLFTSGMREVTENCVVLPDVSCDGFRLVLKCLYTGEDVLTLENLYEFWLVAHRLRINFLLDMTETFAIEAISIDTWENIYRIAKLLESEKVLYQIHFFMLKNFDQISLTSTFLQLPINEVLDLLKSNDLIVKNEDVVLESVIKWVNYVPTELNYLVSKDKNSTKRKRLMLETKHPMGFRINEEFSRKDKFPELLREVRTCLVSHPLLTRVYKMDVLSTNKDSKDIIVKALLYHVKSFRQGHWPSAALHRSSSGYTHGGVFAVDGGNFKFISAHDEKMYTITNSHLLQDCVQLTTVQGELYAIGKQLSSSSGEFNIAVFRENKWNYGITMKFCSLIFFSDGDLLHIYDSALPGLYSFIPKPNKNCFDLQIATFADFPNDNSIVHAMSLKNFILCFKLETLDAREWTDVIKIDLSVRTQDLAAHLDVPAEHLISFKNDNNQYILNKNCALYLVFYSFSDRDIQFQSIVNLWDLERKLYGALAYKNKLIIIGEHPGPDTPKVQTLPEVPHHFKVVKYWGMEAKCSNIAPIILPTNDLKVDS